MNTEDEYFIQKCLNGESEAFGFLVDKYKASVYYFLLSRLRNVHDAEDVSQKVFLRAYEKLGHLRRWESFAKWLYSIAYTQCRNFIRERQNRPDSEYFEEQDPGVVINHSMDSYYENQANESLKETIEEALNSLPEMYREVLVLHYIGGMKNKEIAVILGTSIDNIKQRLSRARSMLKEEVIAMMNVAYDQHKLTAKFTFNIMETIKKLKIHPISTTKGVPWGLSLATGLIIAIMSINPALIPFTHIGTPVYAPLPGETKVLKIGEIPVDTVKISNISILSSNMGKGKGGEPKQPDENALFMALQGEGKWEKRADMPTARAALCTAVVNGKIYAIGGASAALAHSNVEEYDPTKDKWEIKSSMPQAKQFPGACSVNGKIYAFGGLDGNNNVSLSAYEYDPVLDKWTAKKDMPKAHLNNGDVCVLNSKIYIFGAGGNNHVYEFDPAEDSWTEKAEMPTERGSMSAYPVNGKIYVIGGAVFNPNFNAISTVEEYDPVADTWEKKSDMPTARGYFAACAVGTKIYAMGGMNKPGSMLATVEIYDTLTDTWTKGVDIQIPRYAFSASFVGGKIYTIGGNDGINRLSVVEEFDTGFISKSVDPSGKLPKTWGKIKAK